MKSKGLIYLLTGVVYLLISFNAVNAQSFGKQKVQYEVFDFQTLHSSPFAVHYYPEEYQAVKGAVGYLHKWIAQYKQIFTQPIPNPQHVIFYANHADFQQTTVTLSEVSQGTGGFTEGLKSRIVMPLTGICSQDNHVVGHELVHVYHYALMKSRMPSIPLWIIEGMSEYISVGNRSPLTAMWLRDDLINNHSPTIEQISRGTRYFPYRYGHAVWSFIAGHWGDTIIEPLFKNVIKQGLKNGMETTLNLPYDSISILFQNRVQQTLGASLKGRINPSGYGSPIIRGQGGMNISPAVSPDGKYITFFSRRDVFTLSLYLAEVSTGKIIKRLIKTTSNPYFDALSFINTTGAWSPDSKRFALISFKKGDNGIAILNIKRRKIEREISLDTPQAITALSWSPNGSKLVIAGTQGGISDLFIYNLATDSLEKITNTIHAEIQPSWSPDGKSLVFATDRFTEAHPDSLADKLPKIGIMNLLTRNINIFGFPGHVKHICPYFSSDGKSIYFVADPDGFSNIFRYDFTAQKYFRLTNIATGISGLSELSPALSVSRKENLLVFNVFDRQQFNIYTLSQKRIKEIEYTIDTLDYDKNTYLIPLPQPDDFSTKAENHLSVPQESADSTIQPVDTTNQKVSSSLINETNPLHDSTSPYDPQLKLLSIGDLTFGFSANQFGALFGGSARILFGDILGIHRLGLATQVFGDWKNISFQAAYANLKYRVNWGTSIEHLPFEFSYVYTGTDTLTVNGQLSPVDEIEFLTQRTFVDQATLTLEYPFSAHSRLEFSPGYTLQWHQGEGERITLLNGQVIQEETFEPDFPEPLNLFQSNITAVSDFSIPGFTAPIDGWRYRLGLGATTGSLSYLSVLFDYRHYFFLRPFTVAFRGIHFGRYFKDSESNRLSPLSLSNPSLIRGYGSSSFSIWDCSLENGVYTCPEIDRLIGSRIAVGNAELRIPILGVQGMGLIRAQFIPTNLIGFFDIGTAWTSDDWPRASLDPDSKKRIPVTSAGVATRSNLGGILIFQLYFVYPFQHATKEWQFGFLIEQGW